MTLSLSPKDKRRLLRAVQKLPCLRDPQQRQIVIEELRTAVGPGLNDRRTYNDWGLLNECINNNWIEEFMEVLAIPDGDTREYAILTEEVDELLRAGAVPGDQRSADIDTVSQIPDHVRYALESVPINAILRHSEPFLDRAVFGPEAPVSTFEAAETLRSKRMLHDLASLIIVVAHLSQSQVVSDRLRNYAHSIYDDEDELDALSQLLDEESRSSSPAEDLPADPDPSRRHAEGSDPAPNKTNAEDGDESGKSDVTTSRIPTPALGLTALKPPSIWGGVPPKNTNFVGRTEILDGLYATLDAGTSTTLLPRPLYGLGGVGKSQIAIEYAYRYQSEYDLVWWVTGDDARSIRRSIESLARRLGLPLGQDVDETIEAALDSLRRGDPYARWLLVFDNAGEPDVVRRYLPTGNGHVLITSRSRSWANEGNALEIDVFQLEESTDLLTARWADLSEESAEFLATRLGHLPLALEQAVAVHNQTGMPVDEYLSALNNRPSVLLDQGAPSSYASTVASSLALSLESLRQASTPAASLLELCCMFGPQPIALPILGRGRSDALSTEFQALLLEDIAIRAAVRQLGRFAVAKIDPARDLLTIHNLVREIIRSGFRDDVRKQLASQAQAVLASANPGQPDNPNTWPFHAQLAPHVQDSGALDSDEPAVRQLVLDQIRYLYAIGDYNASRDLADATTRTWADKYDTDDRMRLIAARHLANALRARGDYQAARKLSFVTLEQMRAALNADDELLLATANSAAADLRIEGNLNDALQLDLANLDRHRATLGSEDPATLRVLGNLAIDYRLLGDFKKAQEFDKESVETRAAIYGDEHPRTLHAYASLARDLYGLGRYQEAMDLMAEKLPLYEERLPARHGDLLVARRLYSILLRKRGRTIPALHEAQTNYDEHLAKFGAIHEHTQSAAVTLSNSFRACGNYDKALELSELAIRGYHESFGETHPFALAAKSNHGICLLRAGNLELAYQTITETLAGLTSSLGDMHPHTLSCMANLAMLEAMKGELVAAAELSKKAYERSQVARVPNHPNTLLTAANHAIDLERLGNTAESSALRKAALDGLVYALGSENPELNQVSLGRHASFDIEVAAS